MHTCMRVRKQTYIKNFYIHILDQDILHTFEYMYIYLFAGLTTDMSAAS